MLCWGRVLEVHPPLARLLVLSPPSPLLCLELADATTGMRAAQPRGHCMDTVSHHHLCPVASLHVPIAHGTPVGLGLVLMMGTDHPGTADGDRAGTACLPIAFTAAMLFLLLPLYILFYFSFEILLVLTLGPAFFQVGKFKSRGHRKRQISLR